MELDPRLTFETFVVGPANRLAAAAARRAAESPGQNYNPLFVYSASGLGKSHILTALANQARKHHPERKIRYMPLELYLGELTEALERGQGHQLQQRYEELDILLLDDIQFLAGQGQAQEMLLRTLDGITAGGGQVMLASDRPPAEIDGLDSRLLSRFSGGLIVDIGQPDMETRVAIIRKKTQERGAQLEEGVAEELARISFRNVRELQGALNRVLVLQELEGRPVTMDDLPSVIGQLPGVRHPGGGGPSASRVETEPSEPAWRVEIRDAAEEAERGGVEAHRLRRLLDSAEEPEEWEQVLRRFRTDLSRMTEIREQLDRLGNPWPEAAATLLGDPDRLEEAEALLASARERNRPFPILEPGPSLEDLRGTLPDLALRAADRLLAADRPDYNPLYVHTDVPEAGKGFLAAVGRTHLSRNPDARVGFISVPAFAEEFIRAISDGVAGAWRERWWTVEVLLLHGIEELAGTERAQEEFFHLFEALKRRDARIFLASDRLPSHIQRVDDRLRTRFEGGLVLELEGISLPSPTSPSTTVSDPPAAAIPSSAEEAATPTPADRSSAGQPPSAESEAAPAESTPTPVGSEPTSPDSDPVPPPSSTDLQTGSGALGPTGPEDRDDLEVLRELAGVGRARSRREDAVSGEGDELGHTSWEPSRERVVWDWPDLKDRIVERFP